MILLAILLLVAGPAGAHGTLPGGSGFQAGALHPIAATEHMLALVAAGLALGRGKAGAIRAGAMALGAGIAAGLIPAPPPALPPVMILMAMLGFGLVLVAGSVLPTPALALPTLALGWAVAADTDIPAGEVRTAIAGLLVASALILLNAAALSQWAGGRWPLVPRIAGSWLFAIALLVLTLALGTSSGPLAALP